jgi:hypothetical protein
MLLGLVATAGTAVLQLACTHGCSLLVGLLARTPGLSLVSDKSE